MPRPFRYRTYPQTRCSKRNTTRSLGIYVVVPELVLFHKYSILAYPTDIGCKVQMELKPSTLPGASPLATPKTIRSVGLNELDYKTSAPATTPALAPAALLPTPPFARVSTDGKWGAKGDESRRRKRVALFCSPPERQARVGT